MDTVACELKYSGVAMAFLLGAFAATAAWVLFLPLAPALRATALGYVVLQAARGCTNALAWRALRLARTKELHLLGTDGKWRQGTVSDGCVVLGWLVAIRWRPAGGRFDRALLLLPGMADAEAMRKIRVILRMG
jgi:hypothetical protein